MEDCNTLVSDCVVISCCCECLILQLVIFMFIQLPCRVAKKTKEFAKRKLNRKKKQKNGEIRVAKQSQGIDYGEDLKLNRKKKQKNGEIRVAKQFQGIDYGEDFMKLIELHDWGSCNQEIDKVLEELSLRGEFGFGSFWGRNSNVENMKFNYKCKCNKNLIEDDDFEEFGCHVVKFHLIEVIRTF
ncbi:unnamed protein product [Amaranthus hypochondriacus]